MLIFLLRRRVSRKNAEIAAEVQDNRMHELQRAKSVIMENLNSDNPVVFNSAFKAEDI